MFSKLAIFGGDKTISYDFAPYNHIGQEEITAVVDVMKTGVLSGYVGSWEADFYGGPVVQKFEKDWAQYFGVKEAVVVNSWTSGLICALGAIGIEPGDEVIVSPWTMSATATAILHWNAIPVFADIKETDFCIDPNDVIEKITPRTRAILAVDIFGQSVDIDELLAITHEHNLKLVLDSAQAPGSKQGEYFTGTRGDIGGFSLNHHKHIHTGEGGVIVTNDSHLAEKTRLIRNHAEAVLGTRPWDDLTNMIGYNFRLGEIEAAIGIQQLPKLAKLVDRRQKIAKQLSSSLSKLEGIVVPEISNGNTHSYYMYPIRLDLQKLKNTRSEIVRALIAEGIQGITEGYTNLHLLPIFQKKHAYGTGHFPWSLRGDINQFDYSKGICPIAERLHDSELIILELCQFEYTEQDVILTIQAFEKVFTCAIVSNFELH
jgi:dTDP-4-amino-4,6-dideoxygalactose transaminase